MPAADLTVEARRENAAALAAAVGMDLNQASEALNLMVLVTARMDDQVGSTLGEEVVALLSRTINEVATNTTSASVAAELVIGAALARTDAPRIYLNVFTDRVVMSRDRRVPVQAVSPVIPKVLVLLAACYAAGNILCRALGSTFPFEPPDPFVLDFAELGIDHDSLNASIDVGHAYMAGAGAIGNGFLWAAQHLDLHGVLEIADDDVVSSGNLNRQVWFHANDIGISKAERLAQLAQNRFPALALIPRACRLQEVPARSQGGQWLRRLIVAVDSRRARRQLQNEFPGEVFDASTTDIREIVVHHNAQPSRGACLSCIYEPDPQELSREQHIADHLGVSADDVRSSRISQTAAFTIAARFPALAAHDLEGMAYDTLFKQLCSESQLVTPEGRSVIAPFGFVSVLAGTLQAIEVARRANPAGSHTDFNYWRLSPWHPPSRRRQVFRPKQPRCKFCGDAFYAKFNQSLWG
jgi:hypothetical protein